MGRLRHRLRYVVVAFLAVAVATGRAAAHVDYVTRDGEAVDPRSFLVAVLGDPANATLLAASALLVVVAALGYRAVRPAARDVTVFRAAVRDYEDLLPWLLRLSFGLPLVGAGFVGYLFSPAVSPSNPVARPVVRLFGIGAGFLLLFGLTTRATAGVTLLVYLVGVAVDPRLMLANEYVPGLVAIVLVGGGRPSADDVLEAVATAEGTLYGRVDPVHRVADRFGARLAPYERYVPTVVRVGLGLNFVYLGVTQKLLAPGQALAVVAKYDLVAVVPVEPGLWVVGAGLAEATLGVVLVFGVFTRASAMVALGTFTLTLFGLPDDPVLAHVSLFGLASLLLVTGSGPLAVDDHPGDATGSDPAGEDPVET